MNKDVQLLTEVYQQIQEEHRMNFQKLTSNKLPHKLTGDIPVRSANNYLKAIVNFREGKITNVIVKEPLNMKLNLASVEEYFFTRGFDLGDAVAAGLSADMPQHQVDTEQDFELGALGEN